MTTPRFLQIHTLTSYASVLLNRDDSGLAKRLPYGNALRTRISSQCLKRHWRFADDPHALNEFGELARSFRSRELVTRKVIEPLRESEGFSEDVVDAVEAEFQKMVYGDKGTTKKGRQTLLMGIPELRWLKEQARELAQQAAGDAESVAKIVQDDKEKWKKDFRANIKAMRESTSLPAGLVAALFGRMVTSDPGANIAAPVHVAHAFTVHSEEQESDYFTAVDDLSNDEPGADTIQETELTSGLFYGYVVVDIPGLVKNLGGDKTLAGQVLHNLVYLIAETSPGAKLGSTAPYGRAELMLLEAGGRQPRSLAAAYRKPCRPQVEDAIKAIERHIEALDAAYATGEERRAMSLFGRADIHGARRGSLTDLAGWVKTLPERIEA